MTRSPDTPEPGLPQSGLPQSGLPKEYRLLCEAFDTLPGIGSQAAERLAEWLIHHGRCKEFADTLNQINQQGVCTSCNRLMYPAGCRCQVGQVDVASSDVNAGHAYFLIAASESDVRHAESAGFVGPLFVLHGELSPSRNIGPSQLKIDWLQRRLEHHHDTELLLLTGQSVEGKATAEYILRRTGLKGQHLSRDMLAEIVAGNRQNN